ncbi:MAG: restriction endonuclease subunit S, partial [Chloroflexia bacterium]|nr:restriction endonuclease subunit S [Chloroflexia bacterium]
TDTERRITDAGLKQISSGLLPKGTVLLSSRAPIGYTVITDVPVAINQGFIAMVCDRGVANHYVLWWTRTNMDEIEGRANGTTFMEISKKSFRSLPILVPAADVLRAFVAVTEPIYQKVRSNLLQSRALAALRDTLLPKLLSGEIRVREAERIAEGVL